MLDMFLDGPRAGRAKPFTFSSPARRCAGLRAPSPDLDESERAAEFQVATLKALVRMKLIANRRKDQVHLLT